MGDLFSDAAKERLDEAAPLALRLRPRTLDEFVGQEQVLGEGSALRLAIAEDRVGSMILYGPPGTGKTTLARIVAVSTGSAFEELSAVSATVADVRKALAGARDRLGGSGQRTILFLDEIHRFNKAQQDALLPGGRRGAADADRGDDREPVLRGELGAALALPDLRARATRGGPARAIVRRGAEAIETRGDAELVELIARRAGGDARNALNILELAAQTARAEGAPLDGAHVEDAAREAAARLRQGRRRALRLHLGVHQVDARLRPGRGRLLPRGDARGAARTRASSRGG